MAKLKNSYEYTTYMGQACVRFQTAGKYKYHVIVDKDAWDNYLCQYNWTVSMQNKRPSVKTSINKQTTFLWRLIIANEESELENWGTTIDHINHDPLDNRRANLRVYNSAILNSTNISSKYENLDMQFIYKDNTGRGYKIHYNLAGVTYYKFFGVQKYGGDEQALAAAKKYRDEYVLPERERAINEMIKKTRNVEFERGLRDKLNAGELDDILAILRRYGIEATPNIPTQN